MDEWCYLTPKEWSTGDIFQFGMQYGRVLSMEEEVEVGETAVVGLHVTYIQISDPDDMVGLVKQQSFGVDHHYMTRCKPIPSDDVGQARRALLEIGP